MSILAACRRAVTGDRPRSESNGGQLARTRRRPGTGWQPAVTKQPAAHVRPGQRNEPEPIRIEPVEREALRPLMRRYRRTTTVSAHPHSEAFTWIDAYGWPRTAYAGFWHLHDRHQQWVVDDVSFQLHYLRVLGERYHRTGEVAAVRLARPAIVFGGVDTDWFGAEGDWLIEDDGRLRVVPAHAFAANFAPTEPPVCPAELPGWAERTAESLLAPLGQRWRHVQGVAEQAQRVAHTVPEAERPLLIAAAWTHDLGHSPLLATLGFHALDGARALCGLVPDRLAALVAHHAGAQHEARRRGMTELLDPFRRERSPLADALTYADLTVGADGESITVTERLADIGRRHGPEHIVTTATVDAADELLRQTAAVDRQLSALRTPRPSAATVERGSVGDSPVALVRAVGADELVCALRRSGLLIADIARAAGVGPNSVSRWGNGSRTPDAPHCQRLAELRDIVVILIVSLPPTTIAQWLRLPEPTLNGRSPLDAIAAVKTNRVATAANRIVTARRAAAQTPDEAQ